jgi:hypothetical protein
MELAAYQSPLSDEQLKELGRLVVNCGFAEFLLGMHVSMLHEVPYGARWVLVHQLPLGRKLDMLQNGLEDIPGAETRGLVRDACKLMSPAIVDRNLLLHGMWGYEGEGPESLPVVATAAKKTGQRRASDITKSADVFAIASRKLLHAVVVDSGGQVKDEPERLVIVP